MAFLSGLRRIWTRDQLNSLVDRVTARTQNAVWRRVCERVSSMSIHEARGYIRARSTAVIEREMGVLILEEPLLAAHHQAQIVHVVQHRVVRRLLLENLRQTHVRKPERRMVA